MVFFFFQKNCFILNCVCLCLSVCLYVHVSADARRDQKRSLDPVDLGLQEFVSCNYLIQF